MVEIYTTLSHIAIHENKVAEASGHDEEVENFEGAEELMLCIEQGEL